MIAAACACDVAVELVVIDNGSHDGTRDLLAGLAERYAFLRIAFDPQVGKAGALNRALPRLEGRAVLFTDDDVHVPETWVGDMATPILRGLCDAVAGKVILPEHLSRPWLTPKLRVSLAELTDTSSESQTMIGANMAASIAAARRVGFDESLGPGSAGGLGEDILFNLRLRADGRKICGSAGPPVEHHLDPDRLSRTAMLEHAAKIGEADAYLWHHWLNADLELLRLRQWRAELRLACYRLSHSQRADAIAQQEYDLACAAAFAKALITYRGQPPRYAQFRGISYA